MSETITETARVMLVGPVDESRAMRVAAELLERRARDPQRPIVLWIDSPGGNVLAGLLIYEAMREVEAGTHCGGLAASIAAVLLCAGAGGRRTAVPEAKIIFHRADAPIGINLKERARLLWRLREIMVLHAPAFAGLLDAPDATVFTGERAAREGLVDGVDL